MLCLEEKKSYIKLKVVLDNGVIRGNKLWQIILILVWCETGYACGQMALNSMVMQVFVFRYQVWFIPTSIEDLSETCV